MRVLRVDIDGEFDLDRAPHLLLTDFQQLVECGCERKDIVLEQVGEGKYFSAAGVVALANNLIVRVVGRNYEPQRSVGIGVLQVQAEEVEGVIRLETLCHILQIERIEAGLGLAQG